MASSSKRSRLGDGSGSDDTTAEEDVLDVEKGGTRGRVVFMTNLPTDTSDDEIVVLCAKYGVVVNFVNRNNVKQAFAEFEQADSADSMITRHSHFPQKLRGCTVFVHASRHSNLTSTNLTPTFIHPTMDTLFIRALTLENELKAGATKPFSNVIKANIGDSHAMGQQPITWIRQVMAACCDSTLIVEGVYHSDVKTRAMDLLSACSGWSIGALSVSTGIELVRKHAAAYITTRDGGIASDPDNIVLSGGASESIRNLLKLFISVDPNAKPCGVMIPCPQYPLYSATAAEFGLHQISYLLDEAKNWSLSTEELTRALEASKQHCNPKVICVINPGNPTGQVLSRENIEQIIKFAHQHELFIFADEVYQDNVYADGCKFHSFKKVLSEMGEPYNKLELASFMSVSKGYMGECGQRGGYAEIVNMHPDMITQFNKDICVKLCSTVMSQIVIDCVVNPPKEGEPSYALWKQERDQVLSDLKMKAKMTDSMFNSMEGIHCNVVQGAMYAFPNVAIPAKAVAAAKAANQQPDFFYAMRLLETEGICVVPGSEYGQAQDTFHFRTTILPQPALMKDMLDRFKRFHEKFMAEYK